jgi:phage tail-like protein
VIDVNGTRFHLLLGEADWRRARTAHGAQALPPEDSPPSDEPRPLQWNSARYDVTLGEKTFRFPGSKNERPVSVDDRRGAARDQFGNWYWIAPDRQSILVSSAGSQKTSTFWPVDDLCTGREPQDDGSFQSAPRAVAAPPTFQGLTITADHYLVVGIVGAVGTAGVVIFDLYSGGAPRQRVWPVPFEPFDLDAPEGGGVWILDRSNHRVWEMDRHFDVVVHRTGSVLPADEGWFTCADGSAPIWIRPVLSSAPGWSVGTIDAVAIAAHVDGVLVLERDGGDGFARVHWLQNGAPRGAPVSTRIVLRHLAPSPGAKPFTLIAHDFALGARLPEDPDTWSGRLYIVGSEGNQAYAFGVDTSGDHLVLHAEPEYYPMRLFAGRALATALEEPWYDSGDTWVRLVRQVRPRYADEGEIWSPVFDSGDPGCVWHRLMLDACIPSGAGVDVWSRASDDWRDLTLPEWLEPAERRARGVLTVTDPLDVRSEFDLAEWQSEPTPRPRSDGPELPYLSAPPGLQTFELLFQRARGRYLQVKLVLWGDGRSTPRLRALRAWYPRFSYLDRYLPAVYRDDDVSASFLDRFLANFEGMFTTIEDRIAAAQMLFDVRSAPADTLEWLAQWFGVAIDPDWSEDKRRLFIRHASEFFAVRGTTRGLQIALRLALDDCVDDRLFTQPDAARRRAAPVRIIERFRAWRTPASLVGDVTTAVPAPQVLDPAARWKPSLGGGELHRRYRDAFATGPGTEFPLVASAAPDGWAAFAEQTLGFVPRTGAAERGRWQEFLQRQHGSISALNAAHQTSWPTFAAVPLPAQEPTRDEVKTDWQKFLVTPHRDRERWHAFLARRYRTIGALRAAWGRNWSRFASVAIPDRVPADGAALADWFQFEGTVIAMHGTAHRFTVLLPVPKHLRTDTSAQQRRLARAKAVLDLEKPAHTVYDTRFYWALFRLGQARLGDDTLIDQGSRSPELMGPMVLGEGYLAEAYLAAHPGDPAPDRLLIGRDRIGRSTRIGGP